jgi:cytochrome bd-type quinol oxidase subunit 2
VRVPMLKLDFLRRYDVADMLMLAASVLVVVTILVAIWIAKPLHGARSEAARSSDAITAWRMLAFIHVLSVCVVAAILFVSVDEIEPNPRLALAFKFLIVFVSVAAVARRLMP